MCGYERLQTKYSKKTLVLKYLRVDCLVSRGSALEHLQSNSSSLLDVITEIVYWSIGFTKKVTWEQFVRKNYVNL